MTSIQNNYNFNASIIKFPMLSLFYGHDKKTKSINREHIIWEKFKRPGYHLRLINYYSLLLVASPCGCIFIYYSKRGTKRSWVAMRLLGFAAWRDLIINTSSIRRLRLARLVKLVKFSDVLIQRPIFLYCLFPPLFFKLHV